MRSAMVKSPDRGGVFDVLLRLVRRGLGGKSGEGRQYVSWVHHEDFARAVCLLIEHDDLAGPINVAAANPLPNAGSCARCGMHGALGWVCPPHAPCSKRARSSYEPRPSSSSRADAWSRPAWWRQASNSAIRPGRRPPNTCAASGGRDAAPRNARPDPPNLTVP
jgi:hypothetical protein